MHNQILTKTNINNPLFNLVHPQTKDDLSKNNIVHPHFINDLKTNNHAHSQIKDDLEANNIVHPHFKYLFSRNNMNIHVVNHKKSITNP